MLIKRQVIYRESCPKDGDIVEIDPQTAEYDLLPGGMNGTKFCWIEQAPGLKQAFVQLMTDAQLLSIVFVKAVFAGVGFTVGLISVLRFFGGTIFGGTI